MRRRQITIAAVVGTAFAVACVDMSAPKGPASISLLLLPSPSIVVGDVMRDSLGQPAPLSVNAFDATGNLIANTTKQFFITDSAPVAHFISAGLLMGDTLGTVHVVGQVNGVQTPVTAIPVTVAPVALDSTSLAPDTLVAPFSTDTSQHGKATATVTLVGVQPGTGSQGFVVHFVLLSAPATVAGAPSQAVFLANSQGTPTTVDTTHVGGTASINVTVTAIFLADSALRNGNRIDSAVVSASTSYKGAPVPGSGLRFVVPIKVVSSP